MRDGTRTSTEADGARANGLLQKFFEALLHYAGLGENFPCGEDRDDAFPISDFRAESFCMHSCFVLFLKVVERKCWPYPRFSESNGKVALRADKHAGQIPHRNAGRMAYSADGLA